jgi:hypothetical protein
MADERDPIEDLLASISDGGSIDWDAAARRTRPEHRARMETLRDISRIAAFSRSVQRADVRQSRGDAAMPERWGDLLLLERIGTGAHADVFRAWDPKLQREVALKLIRPAGAAADASLVDEGRVAARIRHPNVVTVHGIDRHADRVGLWMELVRGTTLEQIVRSRGPLPHADVVGLGADIGSALAAVHGAGLLHRDIKPANVVRDLEDRWVLADFGVGQRWDEPALAAAPSGTPMYMAPELLKGAPASERSDVYAVGLLLWFALAGRHPFEADSFAALVAAAESGPAPLRAVRADVPPALAACVDRAIAPRPDERYANARQFLDALRAAAPRARRAWDAKRMLSFVVLPALVLLAVIAVWRARAPAPAASTDAARVESPGAAAAAPAPTYTVEASFLRRDEHGSQRLANGDRVQPGDRLSLEMRVTRRAWVYVLNEDDRGARFLLFPQPRFDTRNPLPANALCVLPGLVGGQENAWIVTSPGEKEYFLVIASPEPVPELEAELERIPAPTPGRPIEYAAVGDAIVERLRGVGGVEPLPSGTAPAAPPPRAFDRFRALAGRETEVRGVWVRQIVLENPRR